MSALDGEVYDQWKISFEQRLVPRLKDEVGNMGNLDPVFQIDDIPRAMDEGGWGLTSIEGPDLVATLIRYADETRFIRLNNILREFRVTREGRKRFLH